MEKIENVICIQGNEMAAQGAKDRRVGLIGIGLVGTALAENLLAAGYEVIGFAPSPASREKLARLGGRAVESPAHVAAEAARIILSLPDAAVVEQVILGPGGLLGGSARPLVILDTTTGEPEKSEALARLLAAQGIQILDAPISGSSQQIRQRQGVVLVGGDRAAYEACLDLVRTLAERFYYLGGPGAGSRAKLASNLILGLNRLVLAEGLVFAERLGLDLAAFLAMLKMTPAYSCAVDVKGQKMLQGDFAPHSKVSQHHKDLRIILEYADRAGQELPLAALHARLLEELMAGGEGDLDTSAVLLALRRLRRGGSVG
jgi:3-hydroxyisobutyrate dehydrogenase-like beta-hydroxyacid dehydrogenase